MAYLLAELAAVLVGCTAAAPLLVLPLEHEVFLLKIAQIINVAGSGRAYKTDDRDNPEIGPVEEEIAEHNGKNGGCSGSIIDRLHFLPALPHIRNLSRGRVELAIVSAVTGAIHQ